jgi:hypothetical protein
MWFSKQYGGSLKKCKLKIAMWSSSTSSRYLSKRTANKDSNRYLHTYIHSRVIHRRQSMEATQMAMSGLIDEYSIHTSHMGGRGREITVWGQPGQKSETLSEK